MKIDLLIFKSASIGFKKKMANVKHDNGMHVVGMTDVAFNISTALP